VSARRTGGRPAAVGFAVAALTGGLLLGAGCGGHGSLPPPRDRECIAGEFHAAHTFTFYTCEYWDRCRVPGDPNWRRANNAFDRDGADGVPFDSARECQAHYEGRDMLGGIAWTLQHHACDDLWDCFDAMVNAPCDRPPIEEVCSMEFESVAFILQELPLACIPLLYRPGWVDEQCKPHDEDAFAWPQ
jgi:hypothetical protein